ncbi:hypothetical protein HDU93_007187, partial [Gonapodya sp. JEL0774]
MPLSDGDLSTLAVLGRVSSSIGIICMYAMAFYMFRVPTARDPSSRMGLYLGLATTFSNW